MQGDIQIKAGVKNAVQSIADGTGIKFFFNFPVFKENELIVWVDGVKIADTGYTIAGVHNTDGGSVSFKTTPVKDSVITIGRATIPVRLADYTSHSTISSETINEEFDRLFAIAQDMINAGHKALHSPAHKNINFDHSLPTLTAGKVVGVNADGTGLEMVLSNTDGVAQVQENKAIVAQDKQTVATDKATVQADKAIVARDKQVVATDKATVQADKVIVARDKQEVATDKATVQAGKAIVAQDKQAVATDRTTVRADKTIVAQDRQIVATDKATVAQDKQAVATDKVAVNADAVQVAIDAQAVATALTKLPNTTNFAKEDLSNVSNSILKDKATAAGVCALPTKLYTQTSGKFFVRNADGTLPAGIDASKVWSLANQQSGYNMMPSGKVHIELPVGLVNFALAGAGGGGQDGFAPSNPTDGGDGGKTTIDGYEAKGGSGSTHKGNYTLNGCRVFSGEGAEAGISTFFHVNGFFIWDKFRYRSAQNGFRVEYTKLLSAGSVISFTIGSGGNSGGGSATAGQDGYMEVEYA